MMRRLIPLVLTWLLSVSWVAAQVVACPALVESALARAQMACAAMGGNQACYGYRTLNAELSPGLSQFAFNGIGDITPIETIQSLRLSALDPANDEWGVAVMHIRADITEAQSEQNVTLVAFGGVTLDPDTSGDYQPMQAFTLSTDESASGCTNVTEDGLLIQTPEGVGKVTLWINQVKIRIGSTVLFQAQPGGHLTVSTFEGSAQVEVMGQMQEAVAGTTVLVPMGADLQPLAPPTVPQLFDAEAAGLSTLMDVSQAFTDRSVTVLLPAGSGGAVGATTANTVNSTQGNDPAAVASDTGLSATIVSTPAALTDSSTDDSSSSDTEPSQSDDGGAGDDGAGGGESGQNPDGGGGSGGQDDDSGLLEDLVRCILQLCILP